MSLKWGEETKLKKKVPDKMIRVVTTYGNDRNVITVKNALKIDTEQPIYVMTVKMNSSETSKTWNKAKGIGIIERLKGQCPDYAHARASSVFSSKDDRTVILTRQDFLPDRTADGVLLFIFSSNILDFRDRRSLSSYINIWLAVRRLIAILSPAGPPRDSKISFRSL